jgi:hypothetical protein
MKFPVERMVSKHLVKTDKLPHQELLELIIKNGKNFNILKTRYYRNAVLSNCDTKLNFFNLPENLNTPLEWWVVPWACKPKSVKKLSDQALLEKVDKNIDKFQVTIQQKKCI